MRIEAKHTCAKGFSLIEMMVVISIMAILIGVSIPGYGFFVSRSSTLAAESDFVSALAYARSESMKRGLSVYVTAAGPANGSGFAGGWTIWVDQNGNGVQNSTDPVVRSRAAFAAGTTIADGSTTRLAFASTGFQLPTTTHTLKVCSSGAAGNNAGYSIQVLPNGLTDVANATCP